MVEQSANRGTKAVGVIGLGSMGSKVALRLLSAGFKVAVYNRTSCKTDEAVAHGASFAGSPRELASRCDTVITVVTDAAAVRDVVTGIDGAFQGARPGAIFVDISTIDVDATRELASDAANRGFQWLDAPTLGSPQGAEAGELAFVVGGQEAALNASREVLECLGTKISWMGGSGLGQAAKLVHNLTCGISLVAYSEALRLGDRLGLSRAQSLEALLNGAVSCTLLKMKAQKLEQSVFVPTMAPLVNMCKDLTLAYAAAEARDLELPALKAAKAAYDTAKAQGLGREDTSSVIKVIGA
jgi:3-hydroxyisobutyrate dehydrogenase-like beta-hydroxyacid dehydrogenase